MSQKVVNDAVLAERSRALQIFDCCMAAGRPMLAGMMVDDGRSVDDAKAALIRLGAAAPHVAGAAESHAPSDYPLSGPVPPGR